MNQKEFKTLMDDWVKDISHQQKENAAMINELSNRTIALSKLITKQVKVMGHLSTIIINMRKKL